MITLEKKKIGIVGFGIVGKAVLRFLQRHHLSATIFDARHLSDAEKAEIASCDSKLAPYSSLQDFINEVEIIIPSPGITLSPVLNQSVQVISELDLFYAHARKPITAVTGTLGKTTITHLLSKLLPPQRQVQTGGNIGIGMLDLLEQPAGEYLLELSSFQLELCTTFAPDMAIWTSFFPNHLDRHGTLEAYFQAKLKCLQFQTATQHALLPLSLYERIKPLQEQGLVRSHISYFCENLPKNTEFKETIFTLHNSTILKRDTGTTEIIGELPTVLPTYPLNWLILAATLHLQKTTPSLHTIEQLQLPDHRGQKVGNWRGINFYNDSKATIMESTLAAAKRFPASHTILLLGGISKGVDRTLFFPELKPLVKYVLCFGKEAEQLCMALQAIGMPAFAFETLPQAFTQSISLAVSGDHVVLAPGGASYDLYTDYQKRGEHFIEMVKALAP